MEGSIEKVMPEQDFEEQFVMDEVQVEEGYFRQATELWCTWCVWRAASSWM